MTRRFSSFDDALRVKPADRVDGEEKYRRITRLLNKTYRNTEKDDSNSMIVGSWGKGTIRQPPNDLDMFFVLPAEVYHRFDKYQGNKQSALLQEVKGVLAATYPQTDIRGDGQVVQVRYNSLVVEIVPAFLKTDGKYIICDTNNGGRYKTADPLHELAEITRWDAQYAYNVRTLARMIKAWRDECNVPLKSYVLEALVIGSLHPCPWRREGWFYYDFFCRDFFYYLRNSKDQYLNTADGGSHFMGSDWLSRCETAISRADLACQFERADEVRLAGLEWQKIFGAKIPL